MMKNVVNIDFENVKNSVPSFITIIAMVLGYSITDGIGMGILIFFILDGIIYITDLVSYKFNKREEKPKSEITIVTLIVVILFLIYFLVPTIL